jgi:hypothetical protein
MPPIVSKLKGEKMFSVTLYILSRLFVVLLSLPRAANLWHACPKVEREKIFLARGIH